MSWILTKTLTSMQSLWTLASEVGYNIVLQNSLEVYPQSTGCSARVFTLSSLSLHQESLPNSDQSRAVCLWKRPVIIWFIFSGNQALKPGSCAHPILFEYQHTQARKQCASSWGSENQWGFEKTYSLKSWPYLGTCKKLGCHRRIFWLRDSFLLYGSSVRNLLGLCSDSLQVLCVVFSFSQEYLLEKPTFWSKEAKDPFWPLLSKVCREKAGFQR